MAQKGPFALRFLRPKQAFLEDGETPVDDLAFLARHRETLRRLSIVGDEVLDVAEINQLGGLEWLDVDAPGGAKDVLRLGSFPNLRQLSVTARGAGPGRLRIDWARVGPVETLWLADPDPADIDALAALPGLTSLALEVPPYAPSRIAAKGLIKLDLAGVERWPSRIDGLGSLRELELAESESLQDLSAFAGARPLDSLVLDDLPNLQSLSGIRLSETGTVSIDDCPNLVDLAGIDPARVESDDERWGQVS